MKLGHHVSGKVGVQSGMQCGNAGHLMGSSGDNENVEQPHGTRCTSEMCDKAGKNIIGNYCCLFHFVKAAITFTMCINSCYIVDCHC